MSSTDEARFAEAVDAIAERDRVAADGRYLWLSHHQPAQFDRCVLIGRRHVCRRCLILYSVCFLTAAVGLAAGFAPWPERYDLWLIWGLCIPATVDFVAEQLGLVRYSARRQTVVTFLLAPAVGRGMTYELQDSWSWEFWGPVLVFSTVWFVAAMAGRGRHEIDPRNAGSDPLSAT